MKVPQKAMEIAADLVPFCDPPLDRCYPASATLVRELTEAGITSSVYKLTGYKGDLDKVDPYWRDLLRQVPGLSFVHFLAVVEGGASIDLTFRQFDKDAEAIRVRSLDELAAEWDEIEFSFSHS